MSKIPIISAGVVIVRKENDQYKFLMMRSGNYNEASAKGKVNTGEDQFDAALREVEEETTIKPEQLNFRWGKVKYTTEPYTKTKNKTAVFYLAETQVKDFIIPVNPEIGKREHDSYSWLFYDEAKKIVVPRIEKVLDWANEIITK